jgi:hypothetical protein
MPFTTTELLKLFKSGSSALYRDKGMVTKWEGKVNISSEGIECLEQYHTTLPQEIKNEFIIITTNTNQIAFIIRSKAYNYLRLEKLLEKDKELNDFVLTDFINDIEGNETNSHLLLSSPSTVLSNSVAYNPILHLNNIYKN